MHTCQMFPGLEIFITEGSHSNVTVYDAEESNPCGVSAITNLPTHPPTYSVRKIWLTRPLTACKKETSGDVIDRRYIIVGWCGQQCQRVYALKLDYTVLFFKSLTQIVCFLNVPLTSVHKNLEHGLVTLTDNIFPRLYVGNRQKE